ncbi:MAG: DUF4149 domain-containing protein [Nitrospiria bacterium]
MIYLAYLCNWLELLGLAILIGGMITLGAVVAPTVFTLLPSMGAGGEVMSTLFLKFNSILAYICLGLILVGFLGKIFLEGWGKKKRYLEGICLVFILGVGIYLGGILTPRMDQLRQMRIQNPDDQLVEEQFWAGHRQSQGLFSVNLLLGLGVLYLNAMEMARKPK